MTLQLLSGCSVIKKERQRKYETKSGTRCYSIFRLVVLTISSPGFESDHGNTPTNVLHDDRNHNEIWTESIIFEL